MIERDLEIRLKKSKSFQEQTITPNRIREALNSLELSKIKVDNKTLYMKSNHSNGQDKLKFAKSPTLINKIIKKLGGIIW